MLRSNVKKQENPRLNEIMINIVQKEDKVLRKIAKDIKVLEISTPKIKKIISNMKKALDAEHDGVAIAAPQIGESVRIFVVSGKIFDEDFTEDSNHKKHVKKNDDLVFINPKIIKMSKEKNFLPEGCLSVRWLYGNVNRAMKATVEARDEHGKKFVRGGSGLLAQIFQHEIDHLDGILFIDKAKDIEEIKPEHAK